MKKIAVFCGSSVGFSSIYKDKAQELGKYFAKNNIALVYGGGKIGLMGEIANAIIENKGEVFGFIPHLLKHEEVVHENVSEMVFTKTMSERKVLMSKNVDGYITLPGGFGTLDEIFEVLTLSQLGIESKPIGLLNVNNFFDPIVEQLDIMVKEGFLKQSNYNMLIVGSSIDELLEKMYSYKKPKDIEVIGKIASK